MKIYKKNELSLLIKSFGIADRLYIAVSVLIFFDLNDPDTSLKEQELWSVIPAQLGQGAVFDPGMAKPRGEVLVTGSCFAPRGLTRRASQVSLRVGNLYKTLNIFGNRFWKKTGGILKEISPAEPFTEMPLIWQNAFGGKGFERNPLGKGIDPTPSPDGALRVYLPNIEHANLLVGSPADRPDPAGFAPLDMMWPQRMKKTGTYDDKWLREHWPNFPQDMNYEYFNAASEDQFIEGFFRAGESIEIRNMHPDLPLIQSRIPCIRPRCFVTKKTSLKATRESDSIFQEVTTRIDTVWLFPSVLRGVVIHRGTTEILDEEYADVQRIFLDIERMDEAPKPIEFYLEEQKKVFSRAVPIDPAPLEAAKKKIRDAMLLVKNLPKEIERAKAEILGKTPVMPQTPEETVTRAKMVLTESAMLLNRMEGMTKDMQARYSHVVNINKVDFDGIRNKLSGVEGHLDKIMAEVQQAEEKATDAQKELSGHLKERVPPDVLAKAGVDPDHPTAVAGSVDTWHDRGFPFVVQCRKNLESHPGMQSLFHRVGFTRKTVERAWFGVHPAETTNERTEWGLKEKKDARGNPLPLIIPPGIVIPRFHEAYLNGINICRTDFREGIYPQEAVLIEGSEEAPRVLPAAAADDRTPWIVVTTELEALLMEQEVGDACSIIALKDAGDKPPKDAEKAFKDAPVVLVVFPEHGMSEAEVQKWRSIYPNSRGIALPKGKDILDAGRKKVDLRQWIMGALPPNFTREHAVEPELPEPGKPVEKKPFSGLSLSLPDIRALAASLTEETKAALQPQVDAGNAIQKEMMNEVKVILGNLNMDAENLLSPSQPQKSITQMAREMADQIAAQREKIRDQGVLTREAEVKMDAAARKISQMGKEAEIRYQEGMAKLAAAQKEIDIAKSGGIPDSVKAQFKGTGIDPEKIRRLTREEVIELYGKGESLSGAILSEVDLSDLDLHGIDLSTAQCQKTKFCNTNLEEANLFQILAMEADFSAARLRGAKAYRGIFTKALFKKADLRTAEFRSAVLQEADMTEANMQDVKLNMSILQKAKLVKAQLSGVDANMCILSEVEATQARFLNGNFKKCVFKNACLDDTDFSNATLNSTIFFGAKGKHVTFAGADMDKARMGGQAAFPEADFRNIKMKHGCLREANLAGSSFKGAVIHESIIEDCDLNQADLRRISAKHTRFTKTNLEGARMQEMNLFQGSLRKARLVNANLQGANLFGVDLFKATVGKTDVTGANLKMTQLDKREEYLK